MSRRWSLLFGSLGVLWAALLVLAPETAWLSRHAARLLPPPGVLASPLLPPGLVLALLLPCLLGRLARDRAWGPAALLGAALLIGVVAGAIEPALCMALAALRAPSPSKDDAVRPPERAAASPPPPFGKSDGDGFLTIDREERIVAADAAALRLLGGDPLGRPIGRYLRRLGPEGTPLAALLGRRIETELQHESSSFRPVEIELRPCAPEETGFAHIRLTDITARAERMAELERMALHDGLTGLPNRALFQDRLRQAIAVAERQGGPFCVMLLDLDRFKQVNDTLGHAVGDRLLRAVGPRLSGALRRSDTLARLGGDEFAVLLASPSDGAQAAATAERLVESMRQPFLIDAMTLDVGVSVGVALYPQHGVDLETLMHNADVAMYKAKRESIGFSLFNAEQAVGSARRLTLRRDMRPAIDSGDIQVVFQPQLAIEGRTVTGAEALVRWHHPTEGLLEPEGFLSIAEHTGLIMPLTLRVLNECLAAQRAWRQDGIELPVAINISPRWLRERDFPKILGLILRNWQGRPEQLRLEIPESAVMLDPAASLEMLNAVAALKIGIVLDHFGTGYSSLPLLQRLPITALKIDRAFVGGLFAEQSAPVIVGSIVKLAHGLGLRVIAGGVATERTARHLAAMGCDEVQGFFIARPMPASGIPAWLAGMTEGEWPQGDHEARACVP